MLPHSMLKKVLLGLIITLMAGAIIQCSQPTPATIPTQAPKFRLPTGQGDSVFSASYAGKTQLIVFWATWCAPCLQEIPILKQLQQDLGAQGFQIIAINLDEQADQVLPKAQARYAFNYPIAIGNTQTIQNFGNFPSLPTAFLVDRDGKIRERLVGIHSYNELNLKIRNLIDSYAP